MHELRRHSPHLTKDSKAPRISTYLAVLKAFFTSNVTSKTMGLTACRTLFAASTTADTLRTAPTVNRPCLDPYCLSERSLLFQMAPRCRGLRRNSISFPSLSRIQRGLQDSSAFFLLIETNRALFHSVENARQLHTRYTFVAARQGTEGQLPAVLQPGCLESRGPSLFETFRVRNKLLLSKGGIAFAGTSI